MKLSWIKPFIFLVILIVGWDLAIRIFKIPPYQIPAPYDVLVTLYQEWPNLLTQAWPTTLATLWGFALSAAFGIPVAMLIAGSKTVEDYVYPLLVFSQSIPKIAIAPLFVVWFGFGLLPKVLSAFLLRMPIPKTSTLVFLTAMFHVLPALAAWAVVRSFWQEKQQMSPANE